MRLLKIMLPLLAFLLWGATAKAQYNPADPPEPGVDFTLTTRCVPEDAAYGLVTDQSHPFGSSVSVGLYVYSGFRFIQWEDEAGEVVSTERNFTYTMPVRNVILTARLVYDPDSPQEPSTPEFKDHSTISFEINPADAGYFPSNYNGSYEVGSQQSFWVTANDKYRFVNWTRGGVEIGTDRSLDYTVPIGDHTLVANFAYDPTDPAEPGEPHFYRTLTLKANPEEAASSLQGGGQYLEGSSHNVYVYGNDYYTFLNWTDDTGEIVSDRNDFTYTMPDRNVTLTANFSFDYNPNSPGEPGTPNPDVSVGENMVMWPRFGMYDDTHVQILCETPGATIHYTVDGSDPTASSEVYTSPFYVGGNILVKAIALKDGMEDSPIVSYRVSTYKTAAPGFVFENKKIKIFSDTPGAVIRYTLDFSDPTEESEVYSEPFEPEENCRIKAYASKEGLTDSPISLYIYRRAEHTIEAPTFSVNEEGKLVIIPSVEGGQTRYTTDGSNPDESSALYAEPLDIKGNFRIKAYTSHINYFDSPIAEYVMEGFKVARPTYTYTNLELVFATATDGAEIRYTLDGSIPEESSTLYAGPLSLEEDCKVTARGFKPNYEPSDTISYSFIRIDHQVATPQINYDSETSTVSMTCATEGAQIRYSTDGTTPTETTGVLYMAPIDVMGNISFIARAFRSGMFASEATTYTVSDQKVARPTASYGKRQLTLTCQDSYAQIHYTTDGSMPTSGSTLYQTPISLTNDCTIRFIAVRAGFDNSDEGNYVFTLAEHQEAIPAIQKDFRGRRISVTSPDDVSFRVTVNGIDRVVTLNESIDVVPSMKTISVTAIATDEDRYDSETLTEELIFHKAPKLSYDGHSVSYGVADDEPYPGDAYRTAYFGDMQQTTGLEDSSIDISDFVTFKAVAESDIAFRSEPSEMVINYFNTGRKAGVTAGHRLEEAFLDWGSDKAGYDFLRVEGDIDRDDLRFLATFPSMKTLDLSPRLMEDEYEPCDSLLSASGIETMAINRPLKGLFKGMKRLTTVVWPIVNVKMEDGLLEENGNPNLLFWCRDKALAPSDAVNIVVYDRQGEGVAVDPELGGIKGHADMITLTAGYPYNAHMPVDVGHIEAVKEFRQQTEIGICRGWETISIPFAAETITHESKGEILPFAAMQDMMQEGPKPFWLYEATSSDWMAAESVKAGMPYIISMPNNSEYIDDYNLPGRIVFSADEVTLGTEESLPRISEWTGDATFEASYMPVEEEVFALNLSRYDDMLPQGSVFMAGETAYPLGAYVRSSTTRRMIPVFDGVNGVSLPTVTTDGLVVESPAHGTLRISSGRDRRLSIATIHGVGIGVIDLSAGATVAIDGLAPGLYIVGGVKVMVK